MAKFNVDAARKAGYSQQQIDQFMQTNNLQPKMSVGGFGCNIVGSTGRLIGDTVKGVANVFNPNLEENTITNLVKLTSGIVGALMPGEQRNEEYAKQLANYYVDRYGSFDNIVNTFYNDPAGLIDDASMVLSGGGSAVSKLGDVAGFGKVAGIGQDISRLGNTLDPIQAMGRGVGKAGGMVGDATRGVRGKLGNNLLDEASNAPLRGLGRNKLTANMLDQIKKTGMTVDQFFDKYNLWNRDINEVNDVLKGVYGDYTNAAYKSGTTFDVRDIVSEFDKEIERLTPIAKQSDSAKLQLKTVMDKKQSFLDNLVENGSTDLNQNIGRIAEAKSYVGEDIPDSMFNMGAAAKGRAKGAKNTYGLYKGFLDTKTRGETAILGASASALENYKKLLNKKQTALSGNKQLPFTKIVAPAAGGILGGFPGAVAAYGADQIANSPAGLKAYSQGARAAGEAIKNVKPIDIKIPEGTKNVFDKGYQASRLARLNERQKKNPFRKLMQ